MPALPAATTVGAVTRVVGGPGELARAIRRVAEAGRRFTHEHVVAVTDPPGNRLLVHAD